MKSRSRALEHATRDFVRQAFEKGLITEEDAELWLMEKQNSGSDSRSTDAGRGSREQEEAGSMSKEADEE